MKEKGIPAEWSVFRPIASHPGGPALGIDGKMHNYPASVMSEHIPTIPYVDTKTEAEAWLPIAYLLDIEEATHA
jgi:hypothetical protein